MDTSNNNRSLNAPLVPDEHEPSASRFLKNREKTPSPPLKNRVIIYDCDDKSVLVQSKAYIRQSKVLQSTIVFVEDIEREWDIEDYHELRIPQRTPEVTIFVDSENDSEPTIENTTRDGYSNAMLVKLYLNRLGATNQVLRFFGQLTTLYVKNMPHWSETPSSVSTPHTVCESWTIMPKQLTLGSCKMTLQDPRVRRGRR